jgi:tRNA dimethylallyltransferase
VAERFGAHILSVDSMQVYRGMDIGTAKPSRATRDRIPHHMVDVADPADEFTVTEFQQMARKALGRLDENRRVVIAGGSGLHYRAVVDPMTFAPTDPGIRAEIEALPAGDARDALLGLDPDAGRHIDLDNPRRVIRALEIAKLSGETPTTRRGTPEAEAVRGYRSLIEHVAIGIDADEEAHARSDARFDRMMADGLLAEVDALAPVLGRTAAQAVGYRELLAVTRGEETIGLAVESAKAATRSLIKRQRTYFRRDPRIAWMAWQDDTVDRIEAVTRHVERMTSWTS